MSKTSAQILKQSYGLIGENDYTFGEALEHYANVIGKATALPKAKQADLIEASQFLTKLRADFVSNADWGKFLKKTSIATKLKLRFGKTSWKPEASKMLWIGAMDAKHLDGFREANGKAPKGKPFFRCDATSPTGLVGGLKRYLEEVLELEGEAFVKAAPDSVTGRASKLKKLAEAAAEPEVQSDQSETDQQQTEPEVQPETDPKDQQDDQSETDQKPETDLKDQPEQPKAGDKQQPTAEAVVEQLASQVEAYGFDAKDISNVLRLLSERLQPKAEVNVVAKATPKKGASKKQASKKAA